MALLSAIGQINIFNQLAGGQQVLAILALPAMNLLPIPHDAAHNGGRYNVWHLAGPVDFRVWHPNQGLSLIIFAGIVSQIRSNLHRCSATAKTAGGC
jgi:preprotein translocase subunit SecY